MSALAVGLAGSACATSQTPSAKDRRQARTVIQRYADAFAADDGRAACRLLTHAVRVQYVEQAERHPDGTRATTCARGFSVVRGFDPPAPHAEPRGRVLSHQTWGPRQVHGLATFGEQGFEVDVAKVRGRWRIYAENLCLVPRECPAPEGT